MKSNEPYNKPLSKHSPPEKRRQTTTQKAAPQQPQKSALHGKKRSDKSEVAPKTTDKIEIPRDKIKIPREEIRKTSDKIQQITDKIAPPTAHRHTPKAQHARNQPQTKIAENRE